MITSLDRLPNATNYIWVKYTFSITPNSYYDKYPYIPAYYYEVKDTFPEGTIVVNDSVTETYEPISGSTYIFEVENSYYDYNRLTIIAGYPKEIYNENNNNLQINNKAELYAKFRDSEEYEYQDDDNIDINLANYQLNYSSNSYGLIKSTEYSGGTGNSLTYDCIIGDVPSNTNYVNGKLWRLFPDINYAGETIDVKFGDDLEFIKSYSNSSFRKLDDSEYNITYVEIPALFDGYGNLQKYDIEIWIRHANEEDYSLFTTIYSSQNSTSARTVTFEDDDINGVYFIIKDVNTSLRRNFQYSGRTFAFFNVYVKYHTTNISPKDYVYNLSYLEIYKDGVLINQPTTSNYSNEIINTNIETIDMELYGRYQKRAYSKSELTRFQLKEITNYLSESKEIDGEIIQNAEKERFEINYNIHTIISSGELYNEVLSDLYSRDNMVYGFSVYDFIPEGMELASTKDEIINSISFVLSDRYGNFQDYFDKDFNRLTHDQIKEIITNNTEIEIINNYNNTGKTLIHIEVDFEDEPFWVCRLESWRSESVDVIWSYKTYVSYDSVQEYGNVFTNDVYAIGKHNLKYSNTYADAYDINQNGDTTDKIPRGRSKATINSIMDLHQDLTVTSTNNNYNYSINKLSVEQESEYSYKLRVRTGKNDVKNLVIYDSLEDYAKNPNLEIVKAAGGSHYWQGEFLGVDTSYAESKGYQVKVYYNENSLPGSLNEDTTWQEYNSSVDKSKVKSLAFEYLDNEGNPAVLPANSLTYVLIKMKSPVTEYKTFAYNGCWTEWNAIDPVTGRPVDFITGINSNIVKVALPSSVELVDISLNLTKEWNDNSNSLDIRPTTTTFKIIPNNDYSNAVEVPVTGTGNTWTTSVDVPKYDEDGEEIEYTIDEDTISLTNNYKYVPNVDNFKITNTLYKEITLTKIWKDNTNTYLSRPTSITFNILQNGNNYKSITFGGELTNNEWIETITVPVFDNNGQEYSYTIEEVSVDEYSTICEEFTCTNTLIGNQNITVKKEWQDNNNVYDTRPDNINIRLKQNNQNYQTIQLEGDNDTWTSDEITVPMYDNEGVKYSYTIEETPISGYGIVKYDQANLKVTNTLSENKIITITKKWIDDNNALGLRPNELKINLLQNGNNYQEITLSGTTDIWTTTIEVPKYDENQKEYTYSIKELTEDLNDDYSNISYSEEELSVTNKLEAKTDITISKIWDDSDNELLTRPEKITVNLLRNGEQFEEIEIVPENIKDNIWKVTVENLDTYDENGKKYIYTIEENTFDQLERYETITYDQTNLTITNKLTLPPKVTLYFTVKNGYTLPGTEDILYDEEGYNNVLSHYNMNGDDEYIFHFELENVDTGEIIEGKLSTQDTLEFDDVPYGTYIAREGEDEYFNFVSMIEIEEVLGVTFTEDEMGGIITISPTGKDIIYGVNITNKIEYDAPTPITAANRNYLLIILFIIISSLVCLYLYKNYSLNKK